MMQHKIEHTNVVYNQLSNKLKGLRPYIINSEGYLVALMIKHRKEFSKAITVFYLTADESEAVDNYMSVGRDYINKSRQRDELIMDLVKSNIHRQIQ